MRDPSLKLREENGCLILTPDFQTLLHKSLLILLIAESIIFAIVMLAIVFAFSQYTNVMVLAIVAGVMISILFTLGLLICFIRTRALVKKMTRLIISHEQITVKNSQLSDVNVEHDPHVEFSCDRAFTPDDRQVFDVFLRYPGGITYYILSGYNSGEMEA